MDIFYKKNNMRRLGVLSASISIFWLLGMLPAVTQADETCQSPYMAKISGQEDFVYVWTLGVKGVGDEQDKLVTVDVRPDSDHYGIIFGQQA